MKKLALIAAKIYSRPGGQGPVLGGYSLHPTVNQLEPDITSDIPCPYCRAPLIYRDTNREARRTVEITAPLVNGEWHANSVAIPSTHRVLKCQPCGERFVAPRQGTPATNAIDPVEGIVEK